MNTGITEEWILKRDNYLIVILRSVYFPFPRWKLAGFGSVIGVSRDVVPFSGPRGGGEGRRRPYLCSRASVECPRARVPPPPHTDGPVPLLRRNSVTPPEPVSVSSVVFIRQLPQLKLKLQIIINTYIKYYNNHQSE